MESPTHSCSVKIPELAEVIVRHKRTEITANYKNSICFDARQKIAKAKCSKCGYSITSPNIAAEYMRPRCDSTLNAEDICVYILLFTTLLLIGLAVCMVRRYNQSYIYGTGGCMMSLLWTHHDCPVQV